MAPCAFTVEHHDLQALRALFGVGLLEDDERMRPLREKLAGWFSAGDGVHERAELSLSNYSEGFETNYRIDRLVMEMDKEGRPVKATIIDFKTHYASLATLGMDELLDYARQVQNYRELVRRCFPGIGIECYLLFVRLMKEDDSHRKADPAELFTPEYFDIIRVADSYVQSPATLTSLMSNLPITR